MVHSKMVFRLDKPNVVGIINSPQGLSVALSLDADALDAVELRADQFQRVPHPGDIAALRIPMIATVRHPAEGGAQNLDDNARRARLLSFLDVAALADVELRSIPAFSDVVEAVRKQGVKLIVSFHDFQRTPPADKLADIVSRACDAGADVVKIATMANSPSDVVQLLSLFEKKGAVPLSVMGMGALGMSSRLVFANCGSALNYGWLDRANVPGQWAAAELRQLLIRIKQKE